jgi:hypothetical protein
MSRTKKTSKKPSSRTTARTPEREPKGETKEEYLPRPGSVPGLIYENISARPMMFGELSVHVGKAAGITGDNLASQLSSALRDLIIRGVVVRLHRATNKVVSRKNARGALYSLVPAAKAAYLASRGLPQVAAAPPNKTREIFSGADFTASEEDKGRPPSMPVGLWRECKKAEREARATLAALEAVLSKFSAPESH